MGTCFPTSVLIQLTRGGMPVPGAVAGHTFLASNEVSTVSFCIPFYVATAPETLKVVVNREGFSLSEIALTVIRLGDAT